jgi:hypothetical protein
MSATPSVIRMNLARLVHHGLVRLKDAGSTKLHLQELRAGDRV